MINIVLFSIILNKNKIPDFYYQDGKRVVRTEAVQDLLRQLVAMGVFQNEEDVRKEALMDFDVVLPPTE